MLYETYNPPLALVDWISTGLYLVGLVFLLLVWWRIRSNRKPSPEPEIIAIEPIWDSDSAITESQKKQITRIISSGAFRRMRDEEN